jgi:hypothetical protein
VSPASPIDSDRIVVCSGHFDALLVVPRRGSAGFHSSGEYFG